MSPTVSLLGIILGLALLVVLTYKNMSILWVAPVAALVVALLGGLNLMDGYLSNYMTGFGNYAKSWFPIFMLGAIFGKLMDISGAARSMGKFLAKVIGAKRAIWAVVITCGLLTYGGISLFVVVFVMYPLGIELFREANLPRRILPGAIALGAFTFSMTMMPGSPQLTNIIPTQYFGTTATAAPITGIVCTLFTVIVGCLWLQFRANKFVKNGEKFTEPNNLTPVDPNETLPPVVSAFIPPVVTIVLYNLIANVLSKQPGMFNGWNTTYALVFGLVVGNILLLILFFKRLLPGKKLIDVVNSGAAGSMAAILNTSAGVGFGAVVQAVPGFKALAAVMVGSTGIPPLLAEAIGINVLAGATGSSSGGLSIGLAALKDQLLAASEASGISVQAFHRVASISAGGLDSLPQCGAVITLLAVCGLTNKDSYADIGMCCCVIPIASSIIAIIMGSIGIL